MLQRRYCFFSFICLFLTGLLVAETLPEYVVTASRESKNVMDEPAEVTVITADEIAASGKTSLVQILEDVAGVRFTSYASEAQAQIAMRGFGENAFGRVKVLVDGKELNNPDMTGLNWLSIPVSSIERIEVLDGPSGVLYGSGAVAGVVNIITKESAAGTTINGTLSYGSFNTERALLNAGYGWEKAGFLLSADLFQTDGYRDRSATKNTNVNLTGFADITDKLTIKPTFTYADIAYEMPGALTADQVDEDPTQAVNLYDEGTERDFGGSLLPILQASDYLAMEMPLNYIYKAKKANMYSYPGFYGYDQHQFEAKPKVSFDATFPIGALSLVGGLDFNGVVYDSIGYTDSTRKVKSSDYHFIQLSYAPYVSGSFAFPRNVTVTTGVRYNLNTLNTENTINSETHGKNSQAFVYDISLNYRPVSVFSVYAKYNTMYRFPFIDEILTWGTFLDDLEPETGFSTELGLKYRPGKLFTATANVYYMLMDNEIAYNGATKQNENLDCTQRIGGKTELTFTPIEFVEISGNASYVNATFAKGDHKGKVVPLVPAFTTGGKLLFKLPANISMDLDVSYTGSSKDSGYLDYPDNYGSIDGYTLLGAHVRFVPQQFKDKVAISLSGNNLLDVDYTPLVYWGAYYPAEGRSITVCVELSY